MLLQCGWSDVLLKLNHTRYIKFKHQWMIIDFSNQLPQKKLTLIVNLGGDVYGRNRRELPLVAGPTLVSRSEFSRRDPLLFPVSEAR